MNFNDPEYKYYLRYLQNHCVAYCQVCRKKNDDDLVVRKDEAWFCSDCSPNEWMSIPLHGSQVPLLLKVLNAYFPHRESEDFDEEMYQQLEELWNLLHSIRSHQKPVFESDTIPMDLTDEDLPF